MKPLSATHRILVPVKHAGLQSSLTAWLLECHATEQVSSLQKMCSLLQPRVAWLNHINNKDGLASWIYFLWYSFPMILPFEGCNAKRKLRSGLESRIPRLKKPISIHQESQSQPCKEPTPLQHLCVHRLGTAASLEAMNLERWQIKFQGVKILWDPATSPSI